MCFPLGEFITGDSDVEILCAQAPPVTIVRKPIDPDMVIEHVRRCLQQAE